MKLSNAVIMAASLALAAPVHGFHLSAPPTSSTSMRRGNPLLFSPTPKDHTTLVATPLPIAPKRSEAAIADSTNTIDLRDEADAIFDCIDINQDGSITKEELRNHLEKTMGYSPEESQYIFDAIDDDGNGEISRGEMRFAFSNFGASALYMTLGLGGGNITDGAYQYSERLKAIMERSKKDPESWNKLLLTDLADLVFDLIDTDDSGEIDKTELREHFNKVTKEANTDDQATEYVETIFGVLDLNDDGVINREEMQSAFQEYDFRFLYKVLGLPVYKKRNLV